MSEKSRSNNHSPKPAQPTVQEAVPAPAQASPQPSAAAPQANTVAPPIYTPDKGKAALATLHPLLAGIDDTDVLVIRVDVEPVIFAMLGVAGFVQSPAVHARFARLPKEDFDMGHVEGLSQACFATLYALAEARAAGALETDAQLPKALRSEVRTLKRRMKTTCEYHLSDDPVISPLLDLLRPGRGHRDDANDLNGYARIYGLRHDVLAADTKNYRPGDAARAMEMAGSIFQALSQAMTPKGREAYNAYVRCWTLANQHYDEVRAAGLWMFRNDAAKDERFPSIYVPGRPNVGRPRKRGAAQNAAATPAPAAPPAPAAAAPAPAGK